MDPPFLLHKLQTLVDNTNRSLFVLASVLLFSVYHYRRVTRGRLNLPPSPPRLPLIGNLHQTGTQLHRTLEALSAKYGSVMFVRLASLPSIVVSSTDAAGVVLGQEVFSDRFQTEGSKVIFLSDKDVKFSPYGEYWRKARKVCVFELLSQKRILDFQFIREEEVSKMIAKVHGVCHTGIEIDLGEMFETLSNNIICRSALGGTYERQDGEKSFGDLARKVSEILGAFSFTDLFPLLGWLDVLTGFSAKLRRTAEDLHTFLDKVIEEHIMASEKSKSHPKDFVDILLHLQEDRDSDTKLTRENIKAILTDMFVGGTDTTAVTMQWALAELMKNPRTLKKAQEEVRRIVGVKQKIDKSDTDQMNYLKCVLKETLRLHPPALITRRTNAAVKLKGYDIPAKALVIINTCAIHRDPKLWDRPEEFIPERFVEVLIDFGGKDRELIAFGGGRRICPGMLFSLAEAEHALANLLYWFDWQLPGSASPDDMDMSDVFGGVIRKKVPLRLIPLAHSFL